jgi:hypothetical protein
MKSSEAVFLVNPVSFVNFVRNLPFQQGKSGRDVGSHKGHRVHQVAGDGKP